MPTTPLKKEPPDAMAVLRTAIGETAEFAEQILMTHCEDRALSADDLEILRLAGIARDDLDGELRRAARVQRLMREAGTDADLAAAVEGRQVAAARLEREGPALRSSIEEATAKLEVLEAEGPALEERIEGFEKARTALRDPSILPRRERQKHESASRAFHSGAHAEVHQLRRRCLELRELLAARPQDGLAQQTARTLRGNSALVMLDPGVPAPEQPWLAKPGDPEYKPPRWAVDSTTWSALLREFKRELVEIEARLPAVELAADAARGEAERVREFYVSQLG